MSATIIEAILKPNTVEDPLRRVANYKKKNKTILYLIQNIQSPL